jgi:glycosyltransferase involved in cell wall biosynthesis
MKRTEQKKLNIAIVCDPVSDYINGVSVSTSRIALLLKERGHKIIFIASKSKCSPNNNEYRGMRVYRFFGVLLPKTEGRWYNAFPTTKQLIKVFQQEDIDIVHIMLPTFSAMVATKAAQLMGIKVIAHFHAQPENLFMNVPKVLGRSLISRIFRAYVTFIYSHAELLIYPSEMAKQMVGNHNKKPSIVISNGINTEEYRKVNVGDFLNRRNIPREATTLLYVGRFHPEKSIDTLIKSIPLIIKDHPNTYVMLVGGGHLERKLKKLTHNLGIDKQVKILGIISDEDKILAYNACDIFILPSLAELEGIVVLEAMACGKPILIANSKNSASRCFVDGNGFLFEPGNHWDLSQKVLQLITDTDLRYKMAEASLNNSKKFDIYNSLTKIENAYHSAL